MKVVAYVLLMVMGGTSCFAAENCAGELDFRALPMESRTRLILFARCARAAYREGCIPAEYRELSAEEWARCGNSQRDDGYRYNPTNGFLTVGSGLRSRLMVERSDPAHVVVALSGCDLGGDAVSSIQDLHAVTTQMDGGTPRQFVEADNLVNWIRTGLSARIDVVGHSLGGCLATYVVARQVDAGGRIRGWTFNGLGLSDGLAARVVDLGSSGGGRDLPIVNVKGSRDKVFKMPATRHYGPVFNLSYPLFVDKHGIQELIEQMRK